jgi:uncharacterized protein YkwD
MSQVTRKLVRAGAVALAAAVMSGVAAVPFAAPASAAYTPTLSSFDARLLYDINHARAAHGVRGLTVVAGTTDVAHSWSCHMAAGSTLSHNLRLGSAISSHGSSLWTTYGENVGVELSTASADALFRAYMASPMHRANILDRTYRYLGIWTKTSGSHRWNTLDFVGSTASSYNYGYGATRIHC